MHLVNYLASCMVKTRETLFFFISIKLMYLYYCAIFHAFIVNANSAAARQNRIVGYIKRLRISL
jgi:hypothetical protein